MNVATQSVIGLLVLLACSIAVMSASKGNGLIGAWGFVFALLSSITIIVNIISIINQ